MSSLSRPAPPGGPPPRAAGYRPRTLALRTAPLAAAAQAGLAREETILLRARGVLARYGLDTAQLDALLADVRQLRRAAGEPAAAAAEALPLPLPAARPADRRAPAPRPVERAVPRAVQLDWLSAAEARVDAVAEYLFAPAR